MILVLAEDEEILLLYNNVVSIKLNNHCSIKIVVSPSMTYYNDYFMLTTQINIYCAKGLH